MTMGKLTVLVAGATFAASFHPTTALAGPTVSGPSGLPRSAGDTSGAPPATTPAFEPSGLREPAPRPTAEVRVQNRFAHNAGTLQLFAGVDYLERRDFYLSPGVRVGATYFPWESFGLELQISHYFSQLNQAGVEVEQMSGVIPDSRAPTWLVLAGGRYSMGYGKMIISGLNNHAIHFQPQALLQAGMHVHDGSFGPSGLVGLGLLVHATPRWFFRLDGGMTVEVEQRVTGTVTVLGFLPSLVTGGFF
jgi:hypothetical protein